MKSAGNPARKDHAMRGVSVEFFCGAIKLLTKRHGPKLAELSAIEDVRAALEQAEKAFIELPASVKHPRKKQTRKDA